MKKYIVSLLGLLVVGSIELSAATVVPEPKIDAGDTAWMITATALVLFMSIPALALFYGGLVRRKNVLNIFMQCMIIVAVISIEWVVCGYSMSFGSSEGILAPFIGGLDWAFLRNIGISDLSPYFISHSQIAPDGSSVGTIPHLVFVMFQCMFAVITPALIIGAFAERINFKGFVLFTVLWSLFVYNPVAHWVWSSDGWLYKLGALDFAGGTVVHINAGIAAIVTAIMLGKRRDYKGHALPPHNITYVVMGAAMLWIGWFGFNAGSGLAADGLAANAFMVTHIAAAAAALTWAILDWFNDGKPTIVGTSTGAVAGLVAITPAAGFVNVGGALIIGILVSLICFAMVAFVKPKMGYDDSLDAFGVHGIGGITGSILTGLLATPAIQSAYSGALLGNWHQLLVQLIAVVAVILYSAVVTVVLFKVSDKILGVRVTDKLEAIGLDETQHGETAYTSFD
ncbi:MAG TPA: ammonium transporter [Paludibacteraceae bacterium]|jgi:Amt family ammonium transporter|nr:ammonium transporter [Paludibacteraceae bacterium]